MTRVLIADDDNVVRDVVRRYLERDGLDVSIAHNGTEALRLLGSERIDVAVLDVMMPGPDGLSLCRSLSQRGDYADPVFSREELLKQVWRWDFGDLSTVTVHVKRLRSKLGEHHRVQTVWGRGYAWAGTSGADA